MESLILLTCCLSFGILLRLTKLVPQKTYLVLNAIVIKVALPALILLKIPVLFFDSNALLPVLMPWMVFFLAIPFFVLLGNAFGWDRQTKGCLILTCGFGNTSFLGIPIMQMLYGEKGVQLAILADQPGTFAALAIFGIMVASYFSSGTTTITELVKKVFGFPPFIFFLAALLMNVFSLQLPGTVQLILQPVAYLVVPLALISVGMQLKASVPGDEWPFMAIGLCYKLILAPAVIFILYILIMQNHSFLSEGSVIEAAMGPMITAAIVATNFGLKPDLVGRIVGYGIPASFITIALWYILLQQVI